MRQYIDSNCLAAEVRMQRTQDLRTVMLVEGASDARFFERFVDHERCYVLSAHDRARALELLRILNSEAFSGVLGVIDADFGRVTGKLESDLNLCFCDAHDLEMMLLRSPALDRVISEHCSKDKLERFYSTRNPPTVLGAFLAVSCVPIGVLALTSLKNQLALFFEGLSFSDFFEKETLELDVEKLVRSVLNKSNRHEPQLFSELYKAAQPEHSVGCDAWEMSRGHDCVELLAFALRSTIGTKKSKTGDRSPQPATVDVLERELRLAFSETDFFGTALSRAIIEWESTHPEHQVLLRSSLTS